MKCCLFCGKKQGDVAVLIVASQQPGEPAICDECVQAATVSLLMRLRKKTVQPEGGQG